MERTTDARRRPRTKEARKVDMMLTTFPQLTRLEREILNHRLAVPDAIAEVLADEPVGVAATEAMVEDIAAALLRGDVAGAIATSEAATAEVLAEAVDGSTYYGAASAESDQMQAAIARAGESLARKVGAWIGRKLRFPAY